MDKRLEAAEGRVIDLSLVRQEAERVALTLPVERVEAHWDQIRGQRLLPTRAEVSPAALQPVLSNVFILERIAKGQARFRVVGSVLSDQLGHDLRGMPLSAIFSPADRRQLSDILSSVLEEPARVRIEMAADTSGDGRPAAGQMTLLPLRSDLGDVTRILGAVALDASAGDRPERFRIVSCRHRTLIGYANDPGARIEDRPGGRPVSCARAEAPTEQETSRRRHLRLVVNQD